MRLLVFQHVDGEHPGSLRTFLAQDNVDWLAIDLHHGDKIPDLEKFDALWVMGGPMDVWDVDEYPWLIEEKTAIRKWVQELNKPFLGFCLGHQLLADALGGTCGPQKPPEIGILDVQLTPDGLADPMLKGMTKNQKCLQWHSVRVAQAPQGATILARSENCNVQAMRVGPHAVSMQYHVEIEPDTIDNWIAIPKYHEALMNSIGTAGLEKMHRAGKEHLPTMLRSAEILYSNFKQAM